MSLRNREKIVNNLLITGTKRGLGKYLAENLYCTQLTRENIEAFWPIIKTTTRGAIIHVGFNTNMANDTYRLLQDNIFATKKLCGLRSKKFIYISTVDVYNQEKTEYNTMKRYAESIVMNETDNYLILRCSALLGSYMRKNNVLKIIEEENPKLSLTPDSTYNFISYQDVLDVVKTAIKKDLTGVYDLVSKENMKVSDIAKICEKKCEYGDYNYQTVQSDKIHELLNDFPFMNKTSHDVLLSFKDNRK